MSSSQILNVLKSSVLFKDISESELKKLGDQCVLRDLNAGESLFFEKDESKSMFIVGQGTIVIKKSSSTGEQNVTNIGSGQHFGEMAFLIKDGNGFESRSAGAESGAEASSVLEIPYDSLLKYFSNSPTVGLIFYRNLALSLAGRIRRTTEDLAGVRSLRLRHT